MSMNRATSSGQRPPTFRDPNGAICDAKVPFPLAGLPVYLHAFATSFCYLPSWYSLYTHVVHYPRKVLRLFSKAATEMSSPIRVSAEASMLRSHIRLHGNKSFFRIRFFHVLSEQMLPWKLVLGDHHLSSPSGYQRTTYPPFFSEQADHRFKKNIQGMDSKEELIRSSFNDFRKHRH